MRQYLLLQFGGGTSRQKVCEVSLKLWPDSRKCCTVQVYSVYFIVSIFCCTNKNMIEDKTSLAAGSF